MRHVVRDSSDEAQVKKAEANEEDENRDLDYILKEPRGRRWLYQLIHGTCHVEFRSHVPGDHDSTSFNEGARSVGQTVLDQIKSHSSQHYMLMLAENHFEEPVKTQGRKL